MRLLLKEVDEQGQVVDFNVQMSAGELNYLVNFAIESLMQLGSIAVAVGAEAVGQVQEVQLPAEIQGNTEVNDAQQELAFEGDDSIGKKVALQ